MWPLSWAKEELIDFQERIGPMRRILRVLTKAIVVMLLVSSIALAAIVGSVVWYYGYKIGVPDHHRVATSASRPICSSDGERIFVPLGEIPPVVREAFLAAEEADFYVRRPINPLTELAKAALFGHKPGDSAVSRAVTRCLMSLRSADCCQEFDWHVLNAIVLYRLERNLSKDQIFEAYLNEMWMGRTAYGAAAGAQAYLGKSLGDLSIEESAYIAAIPRAPSRTHRDSEYATRRRNSILDQMTAAGAISPEEAESAKQHQLRLREFLPPT